MSCDCREFSELLLDLAYGELGQADASRLEAHAATCAPCRLELEGVLVTRKLAAQLPGEAPDPILSEAILAEALRESGHAGSRIAPIAEREPGFFDRLRAALTRPAFAAAAVGIAVLAVSLALYQNAAQRNAPEGVSAGAPFFGPVGGSAAAPPVSAQSTAIAKSKAESRPALAEEVAVASAEPRSSLGTGRRYASAEGSLGTMGPAQVGSAGELDLGDTPASRESSASAPSAKPSASPSLDAIGSGAGYGMGGGGKAAKSAEESKGDETAESLLGEGMRAYDRGDCATASPLFARIADDPNAGSNVAPKALHHLARCARRSGSCGRAIVAYKRLFSSWPGYADRAEAMWEAAACHRRLGHSEQALSLLDQLEGLPGWSDKVRTEKSSIERSAAQQ